MSFTRAADSGEVNSHSISIAKCLCWMANQNTQTIIHTFVNVLLCCWKYTRWSINKLWGFLGVKNILLCHPSKQHVLFYISSIYMRARKGTNCCRKLIKDLLLQEVNISFQFMLNTGVRTNKSWKHLQKLICLVLNTKPKSRRKYNSKDSE